MARYEIQIKPTTAEELGIDRSPDPRIDVEASLARYDALLEAAVLAAYPDAEVIWSERGLIVYDLDAGKGEGPVTDDEFAVMMDVTELAEGLLGADNWAVEKED